jgi:hypothetical protein
MRPGCQTRKRLSADDFQDTVVVAVGDVKRAIGTPEG